MNRPVLALLAIAFGCSGPSDTSTPPPQTEGEQPPVAVNPESPVVYPADLYEQRVEGDVMLQLWIDPTGVVDPDSVWIAESSGYPALDSAAAHAAPLLRYAPAMRDGLPIGIRFLQPIQFRYQEGEEVDGS